MQNTEDLRIRRAHPLISPSALHAEIPLTEASAGFVSSSRKAISDIIHGHDKRLLVVIGPCSIHDLDAAAEYAERLKKIESEVSSHLLIVMRVYFEKPRTTVGWKGYINDPHLDGSFDVNEGLKGARRLLSRITEIGLPTASEFLDTTFGQYYADLVSWGAIGARTAESQVHRQLASGLSMPVGIKNATDGTIDIALDGIIAAGHSHLFPSLSKEGTPALMETTGNPDCHIVLRGGRKPNYDEASVSEVLAQIEARRISTGIMIDCSHANSAKDHMRQPAIAMEVLRQHRSNSSVMGIMVESHLVAGRQDTPDTYGQSITDACIDWGATEKLLKDLC
jgi:3-deoxy-7-phosphoheptulonate synthase